MPAKKSKVAVKFSRGPKKKPKFEDMGLDPKLSEDKIEGARCQRRSKEDTSESAKKIIPFLP